MTPWGWYRAQLGPAYSCLSGAKWTEWFIMQPARASKTLLLAKLGMKYVKTGQFYYVEMRYFAISREEFAALAEAVRRIGKG